MLAVCKQLRVLTITVGVVLAALIAATSASAARPLITGVELSSSDALNFNQNMNLAFPKVYAAGGTTTRLVLQWSSVEATNNSYNWTGIDAQVDRALQNGLSPVISVWKAPTWAEDIRPGDPVGTASNEWHAGTIRPDPVAYGQFGAALAAHLLARYASSYPNTQWRYEVWNEPNLRWFLNPQQNDAGQWVGAGIYRNLLNEFTVHVHAVDPNALVTGGGTAPFGHMNPAPNGQPGPLLFMRKVLCLTSTNTRAAVCPTHADAWSTHPYTSGGPTHHATSSNDVSLGDLPEMRAVLNAAVRVGNLVPSHAPAQFWVTEFGWDSRGPDPKAVPLALDARWTSEALYRAWRAGVSLFSFHQLRDRPLPKYAYQSGFFFCGAASLSDEGSCESTSFSWASDRKKPAWTAFRFPFVAHPVSGRIRTWGRTPNGKPGTVIIQRKTSSGWRNKTTVAANSYGIFAKVWRSSLTRGVFRAKVKGTTNLSLGFSLTGIKDKYYYPFGCGGGRPC
jgi:hypothetical protein